MDNIALSQGGNLALASGALANGTTAGTIKTTVAIPYVIDAQYYSKAITDNISIAYASGLSVYGQATDGSFTGGANGSTRLYGLFLDSSGNVSVVPGPIVDSLNLSNGVAPLQFPTEQRSKVCFGVLRIAVTSGTTFIPGTTSLAAGGVTASYLNLLTIPAEPLRS